MSRMEEHHHPNSTTEPGPPLFTPISFFDNLFMVTSAVCFAYGTVGNTIALPYFLRQRKDIPNRLYIVIILVDITTSLLMLPMCVSYAADRAPGLFSSLC